MNIFFWMDTPYFFDLKKDTTYALIHECLEQKLNVFFIINVSMKPQELILESQKISPFKFGEPIKLKSDKKIFKTKEIDAIWIRKDPPVNKMYIRELLIFNQFESKIQILNHPLGILKTNEKIAATIFKDFTPPTLLSQKTNEIEHFIRDQGTCIIKPIDGFGGQGVFKVTENDTNLKTIIETMSQNESEQIICQKAVRHQTGDKRILILDGKPIGAVNRVNPTGHRNNFMSGGHAEAATITEHDENIIKTIKPYLIENGLFFVGIDIIDNHLIEINVTSPTGLQEINQLNKIKIQKLIIKKMIGNINETKT